MFGLIQKIGSMWNSAPTTQVFVKNGQLSPVEFEKAGDKLVDSVGGWSWKPSLVAKNITKYLPENKQFLMLEKVRCEKRASQLQRLAEQSVAKEGEDEVVVIEQLPEVEEKEQDFEKNFRFYTMYIVYDEVYFTPRMSFSATDKNGVPLSYEEIKQDVMDEYKEATLTNEVFPFFENCKMPTVHPCKHSEVLKTMSDAMREGGTEVDYTIALFIFLKFITSVIPTVEFDSGDLWVE